MHALCRLWLVVASMLVGPRGADASAPAVPSELQDAQTPSREKENPFTTMEAQLRKIASVFSKISVEFVSDPNEKASYTVKSGLNAYDWSKIDPDLAAIREALKSAAEPKTAKEKAVRDTSRAVIFLRDQNYSEAARILAGESIADFLSELQQNASFGGNVYLFRGLLAEREGKWLEAIKNYEIAKRYETEDTDAWMRRWRCYAQLAADLKREHNDREAQKYKRKAEDEFLSHPTETNLKVLGFDGPLKGDRLPPRWTRFDFVPGSTIEFVRDQGQPIELKITTDKSSVAVGMPLIVDFKKTPFISWEWRSDELPEHGDVRAAETDDQACQLVLAFAYRGQIYLLNYGWDTNAPVGTITARDVVGGRLPPTTMFYYVVRTGPYNGPRGELERVPDRNIKQDLKKIFETVDVKPIFGRTAKEISYDDISIWGIAAQGNTQHSKGKSVGVFGRIWLLRVTD